jgi:hypothetical protein
MSTETIERDEIAVAPAESLLRKVGRVLSMGLIVGVVFLFICRDLLQTPGPVYAVASGIGVAFGIALELAASAARAEIGRAAP